MLKMLLGLIFLLTISPANAQTPINQSFKNSYIENCKAQASPNLKTSEQIQLCRCTADEMVTHLSMEDMTGLQNTKDPKSREILNKMIIEVYAPCISVPAKAHYFSTCMNDPNTQKLTSRVKPLCNCLSDQVTQYLEGNAQDVFRDVLTRNPTLVDPLKALYEDPVFMKFAQKELVACYNNQR